MEPQGQIYSLDAGHDFTCALFGDGLVKCWGGNDSGQLGLGDTNYRGDEANEMGAALPSLELGAGRVAQTTALGYKHACVLLDDESVKCWGSNSSGQLGQGDTDNRGDNQNEMGDNLPPINLGEGRRVKAIGAGFYHTCALLDNGSVKCWGGHSTSGSSYGTLGQGNTERLGDGPNEMGDNLTEVDLGGSGSAKAIRISVGSFHTCALLETHLLKCWGYNGHGQLGLGNNRNQGDDPNEMGDNLPEVDLGSGRTTKAVRASRFHTCAILDDNSVKCWGSGIYGKLGQGNEENIGKRPSDMGDNLSAIDLGTGRTAKTIAVGEFHACAILDDDSVKCWGSGANGRLGLGNGNHIGYIPNQMGDNMPRLLLGQGRVVQLIKAGGNHTCVLLDDHSIKCWGKNSQGQLGLGDSSHRGDDSGEMGDNLGVVDLQ